MNKVLIDLHYLPSLEYFACLNKYDQIIIEREEYFVKQTYRNRCHILSANKIDRLTVPVIGGNKKIKVKDIQIDYNQKWLNTHWRAITSAYGRAPFFEFFVDYFGQEFQKREKYLFDFNYQLLTLCLKLLGVKKEIKFTERFEKYPGNHIIDLRSVIHPKKSYSENGYYRSIPYQQVFGKGFVANLSIVDILFCQGPGASQVVTNSTIAE